MSFNTATLLKRAIIKSVYLITCSSILLVCKNDNPKEWSSTPATKTQVTVSQDSINAKDFDSLLFYIDEIQNELFCAPGTDLKSIKKLVNRAYDTSSGCFHTVGKGVINPNFPPEAQNASRKTASKYKGEQWALTFKSWYIGKKLPACTHASGQILYSKMLYEKLVGDTLLVLLEVPLGSISLPESDIPQKPISNASKKHLR